MIERAQRYAAKTFAITYLLSLVVIMVAFSRFYAPYLVWGNGEETARHFITHEQAIRFYLAGAFLHGVGMIVLLTALYVILRPVNRGIALFAAFSKLIYAVFWFILLLDLFGALRLLADAGGLRAFGLDSLAALAGSRLEPGCVLHRAGLQRAGIGSLRLGVLPVALRPASPGPVGYPQLPLRGILRICLSLLSWFRGDCVTELVRTAAHDLRVDPLRLALVPGY
jgi:hypothetical protein